MSVAFDFKMTFSPLMVSLTVISEFAVMVLMLGAGVPVWFGLLTGNFGNPGFNRCHGQISGIVLGRSRIFGYGFDVGAGC